MILHPIFECVLYAFAGAWIAPAAFNRQCKGDPLDVNKRPASADPRHRRAVGQQKLTPVVERQADESIAATKSAESAPFTGTIPARSSRFSK